MMESLFPVPRYSVQRSSIDIIDDVMKIMQMHQDGLLGGEVMPEDVHPKIDLHSKDLWHYFTLSMALNYQRNSYSLWVSATAAFNDPSTKIIFLPERVSQMSVEELAPFLLKHKVALQPKKHSQTWHTLCVTISEIFDGNIQNLFVECDNKIDQILQTIQVKHKKRFPYLSGPKIANYWLYVIHQYTDAKMKNLDALSVAPDTHVVQSSLRLGLISQVESEQASAPLLVASRWKELLADTGIPPINIHTPLWLWSRSGFRQIIDSSPDEE